MTSARDEELVAGLVRNAIAAVLLALARGRMAHKATCPTCGRKTDRHDVSRCDLAAACDDYRRLVPLPPDDEFFWLRCDRSIGFDVEAHRTLFGDRLAHSTP